MSESFDRSGAPSRVYVYDFAEGRAALADLLGGKRANLAEMTWLGLPVPVARLEAGHAAVLNRQDPDGDGTR